MRFNKTAALTHPQVGVELIQDETHGAGQVTNIRSLLIQSILKDLKVLHPLHRKTVIYDVSLIKIQKKNTYTDLFYLKQII